MQPCLHDIIRHRVRHFWQSDVEVDFIKSPNQFAEAFGPASECQFRYGTQCHIMAYSAPCANLQILMVSTLCKEGGDCGCGLA
jgi:hypothetical protein